jgi:hypothetical protein
MEGVGVFVVVSAGVVKRYIGPKEKTTGKKEWASSNTYSLCANWPHKKYMHLLLRGYDVPMGNPNPPGGGTDPGIR